MPKNRGPGGKGRKKAKGSSGSRDKTLLIASAVDPTDAEYGFIKDVCGQGHYRVVCNDGKERLGVLRGSMRRRVWVRMNDMVLVTRRQYQDDKCDIVHKYGSDEVLRLMSMNEVAPLLCKLYNCFDAGAGLDDLDAKDDAEDGVVFDEDAGYLNSI